jgi:hypothetical protein
MSDSTTDPNPLPDDAAATVNPMPGDGGDGQEDGYASQRSLTAVGAGSKSMASMRWKIAVEKIQTFHESLVPEKLSDKVAKGEERPWNDGLAPVLFVRLIAVPLLTVGLSTVWAIMYDAPAAPTPEPGA